MFEIYYMRSLLLVLSIFKLTIIFGQYCESDREPDRREVDTTVRNIKDYFLHGHINGHFRNYFMSTINAGDLTDHYAHAIGGSLAYSTASWKGLQFGIKGIFSYNFYSSQLTGKDSTILPAKWEVELFDILHPAKKNDLDRLEELYLSYENKHFNGRLGKIDIDEGPLLKRRDGRMKPFVYKGLWTEIKVGKNYKLFNGIITGVSPRGMTEWYNLNEAIGLLSNGYLNDSTHFEYHDKANSLGLLVNGFRSEFKDHFKIEVWNYYLHHIQNTTWSQFEYEKGRWGLGLQYVVQIGDPYQNKLEIIYRYFDPSRTSNTISGQIKFKVNDAVSMRLAYLASIGEGRFVFPREITREDFYTSIPRSWFDGRGKTQVSLFELGIHPLKSFREKFQINLQSQVSISPERFNYDYNKYNYPNYLQLNLGAKYDFRGKLEGLHLNILYMLRYSQLTETITFEDQYYKTNLHHFNLILDVVF